MDKSTYDHYLFLEIKFPYKYRNHTIGDASENNYFCLKNRNGHLNLKKEKQLLLSDNWSDGYILYTLA